MMHWGRGQESNSQLGGMLIVAKPQKNLAGL